MWVSPESPSHVEGVVVQSLTSVLFCCAPFEAVIPDTWRHWLPPLPFLLVLGDTSLQLLSAPLMSYQQHLLPVLPQPWWQGLVCPSYEHQS